MTLTSSADFVVTSGKKVTITAAQELTLKFGNASIVFKANGDVEIKGSKITLDATGEIRLKGSKIVQN